MPESRDPIAVRTELEELARELASEKPVIAERLNRLLADLADPRLPPSDYISTGAAARALGVSLNTVKNWVRKGVIRDAFRLPTSRHTKVSRAEIERLRLEGRLRPSGGETR